MKGDATTKTITTVNNVNLLSLKQFQNIRMKKKRNLLICFLGPIVTKIGILSMTDLYQLMNHQHHYLYYLANDKITLG